MTRKRGASVLGVLPPPGGSLSDLERHGQLERLLEHYFPAYVERFSQVRYFSYEPETLDEFTSDRHLRRHVHLVAPVRSVSRHIRALDLGIARRRLIRECDVVRVLQAPGGLPAALARARYVVTYGYPYVDFTSVSLPPPLRGWSLVTKQALMRRELSFILRRAAVTIVTTDAGESDARAYGARTIERIPNGVDTALFRPEHDVPREYDVTFVGRLSPQKDVPTLVRAVERLARPIRVAIVGDGPEREAIGAACARARVDAVLLGRLSNTDVARVLARSRCFVLPSRAEGHPKALLEAMSTGLPCVASDIPGIRELAPCGGPLLFPTGDDEQLAALIASVLDDERLAGRMGSVARRIAEDQFDLRRLLVDETALLAAVAGTSRDR